MENETRKARKKESEAGRKWRSKRKKKKARGDETDVEGHVAGSWGGVGCCERREEDDLQTADAFGACGGGKSACSGKGL